MNIHFGDMSPDLAVYTGAVYATQVVERYAMTPSLVAHQMKIPRLCDAHLGFLALQSAQTSGSQTA